jgi:hypothetical protein
VDPDYMPEELRNREIMDCQYRIDCLLKQIEERNDPIYDNPNVYDPLKSYIVSLRNRIMHLSVKVPFHSYQYIKVDY